MKVFVGLPYLRDVYRKARSGCFGPFARHEYFPVIIDQKKEEKEEMPKKKEEEDIEFYNYKNREENQTEKKRRNITFLAT